MWCYSATTSANFLSTLSLRRATILPPVDTSSVSILSTLSLTESDPWGDLCYLDNIISIHALLTESDAWNRFTQRRDFISIHALLTESDLGNVEAALLMWNFIHALLTESDLIFPARWIHHQSAFLSTLSLRRATLIFPPVDTSSVSISIHALLTERATFYVTKFYRPAQILSTLLPFTESDSVACGRYYQRHYFIHALPHGERPACRSADTGCP